MPKSLVVMALITLMGLVGCVPSLHPLYTKRDVIFEPALLGVWTETPEAKERWSFTQAEAKAYRLVYTDDEGKPGGFVAHLVKLQGTLFLDLYPEELTILNNDFYKWHFLQVHSFLLIEQLTPTLHMAAMEPDSLKAYVKANPTAIRHEIIDDTVVLTASTSDLQVFVVRHFKTKGLFGDRSILQRVSQ